MLLLNLALALAAHAEIPATPVTPDPLPNSGFYLNSDHAAVYGMIDGAHATLDIEIYQMGDTDVIAAIRRAVQRGVRVRVIREPQPLSDGCDVFRPASSRDDASCTDQKRLREEVVASPGGAYVRYNKQELCTDPSRPCFEHGKMVISDSRAVLISTGNFNSSNLCNLRRNPSRCNRDFSMIERDAEVVSTLAQVFERDLVGTRYDVPALLAQGTVAQKITVSPHSLDPMIRFIDSATTSLKVQNQYLKEPPLNDALIRAARRGVRVEVMVASACAFGRPSRRDADNVRAIYGGLESEGIAVRMFPSLLRINGKPGYLHAKAMLADGSRAWVGSVNGSSSATSNNREFGLFFAEPSWVSQLDRVLTSDHASPDSESWQESINCLKDELREEPVDPAPTP